MSITYKYDKTRKHRDVTPFGPKSRTIPIPPEFFKERMNVISLISLFPFCPRKLINLPKDYKTHTAPMLWGPFHQQSAKHRAKACHGCGIHFAAYPEEDKFFSEMGHEHFKHHNFRKFRFHSLTYIYIIYTQAGYDMKNRLVRAEIIDNLNRGSSSKRNIGFRSLENNPHFGALRKMYNDELIKRMGHDPKEIGKAVFERVMDMAIPEYRGKEEIMKTDRGKREALSTLAYMSLPEVHEAIQSGDLSQHSIRLEDGDKVLSIPINYTPPSLPSDSEATNENL